MGTLTATSKSYKHNDLDVWGKGNEDDKDDKYWNAVLRQAVVNNYLVKDIENYGLLKVTDKGKEFLKKPHSIKFTRDHDFNNTDKSDDDDFIVGGKAGGEC